MSKFLEVANTFKEASDADAEYFSALRGAAAGLRNEFEKYLGAPSGNQVNINGTAGPHVAIGDVDDNGHFRGVPQKKFLRTAGSKIRFAILFTYDPTPNAKTQGSILFPLVMESAPGGFTVWLNELEKFDVTSDDMTPLFDVLYERALEKARTATE